MLSEHDQALLDEIGSRVYAAFESEHALCSVNIFYAEEVGFLSTLKFYKSIHPPKFSPLPDMIATVSVNILPPKIIGHVRLTSVKTHDDLDNKRCKLDGRLADIDKKLDAFIVAVTSILRLRKI